ncbi:MAG: outer membrane beta-barrel protein [Bacteroidota bacterium]
MLATPLFRTSVFALALLFSASLAGTAHAQNFQFGGHLMLGVPQGEFADNLDTQGFGGDLFFGVGLGNAPVVLGIEGGFMIYGSESRRVPFSTTIPDVTVEVTTTNNFVNGLLVLRFQPQVGSFRPYADAVAGINYLSTETQVDDEDGFDDRAVFQSTNFDDLGFAYGVGGGVAFKLFSSTRNDGSPFDFFLDTRVRYLIGSETEYLREGDIERTPTGIRFTPSESKTDVLFFQLGVNVVF